MDYDKDIFFNHSDFKGYIAKYADLYGPNGWLLFVSCDSGTELARNVRQDYINILKQKESQSEIDIPLIEMATNKFEGDGHDGTCPRLPHHVGGADVYLFQNVMDKRRGSSTVNDNIKQLEQMAYTLKAHDAGKVTVVIPYFPYGRQERPSFMQRESALARKVADDIVNSGVDRTLVYHPHTLSLTGFFPNNSPLRYISGLDLFIEIFSEFKDDQETIACSTDAGGMKEVMHLAGALGLNYGFCAKDRPEQKKTKSLGILGEFKGKKRVIIPDDESATFGSCFDAMEILSGEFNIEEFYLAISHMRCGPDSLIRIKEAHERFNMKKLHITDSVPQIDEILELPFVECHSLSSRLAFVINRMHYNLSVSKLFYSPPR